MLILQYKCSTCKKFVHKKCMPSQNEKYFICSVCINKCLPFFKLQNLEFLDNFDKSKLPNCPSFNIQSLLDDLKRNQNENNEFLKENLKSTYYSPEDFSKAQFNKKSFSILHLNIASLSAHFDELINLITLLDHPFDIISLTETRFKQNRQNLINITLPGYHYYETASYTNAGGSLIYIKNEYSSKLLPEYSKSTEGIFESTFVEIKNKNKSVVIGSIYRHPTQNNNQFIEEFLHPTLDKLNNAKKKVIITGDFNYDLIKYDSHKKTSEFYDLISSYSYRPCILQPSRVTYKSRTLIDNIFINDLSCSSDGGNLTYSISDHFQQFSICDIFSKKPYKKETSLRRNFRNFKYEEFLEEMSNINWNNSLNEHDSVDKNVTTFYNEIDSILNIMAPLKKQTKKELRLENRPWITKGILISMRKRDALYKQLTKENNPIEKMLISNKHKKYRNLIVTLLRRSKANHYNNYFEQNKQNVKKTWDGIRSILSVTKKNPTKIDHLNYNGKIATNNAEKANVLNDFFTNIGKNVEKNIPKSKKHFQEFLNNPNTKSVSNNQCSPAEIFDIIKDFAISKASGPHSIPTKLLKISAPIIVPILTKLTNKSLNQGIFPRILKFANVCPIFKKGDFNKCENYRPISLLSNLGKILEKIMYTRIGSFFEECNILFENQFGFRKSHSTDHALISIVEKIRKNLDNRLYTCGVFVDLAKAFDTVNHDILIKKLEHYGIKNSYSDWFKSYLSNRKQYVTIADSKSTMQTVTCGVPQGSVLGPLLFLIYINDMNTVVKNSIVHHFADDTNLLSSDKNLKKLKNKINKELVLLFDWLCANRLSLNAGKTEFIIFRPTKRVDQRIKLKINQITIKESNKIKYLGVLLDRNLSWNFHISELCKKLSRAVGMLYKMKNLCSTTTLRSLYFSLFHSHLTYGLLVWGLAKTSLTNKIFLLQKSAIQVIAKSDFLAHTDPLFHSLKIPKFADQYLLNLASTMWDYDKGSIPKSLNSCFKKPMHSYNTRFVTQNKISPCLYNSTKFGMHSFRNEGTNILNLLKDTKLFTQAKTKKEFNIKLKNEIINSYGN